ncbi:hypothetical protein BDB00DRAFT_869805 [Zychaea mexicana]|uniref:uncharacterized protein n=1 Tax=Zychaea mexicana TaxID=64656 RepID=UPI0022FE2CCC|nr:uncharacterized protein BDB00DRAFT_869805 [Zychaea mexicana]KAI9496174.1 hypothetical protein BDB00DRAFT_869805 [Zychaea mexicana]
MDPQLNNNDNMNKSGVVNKKEHNHGFKSLVDQHSSGFCPQCGVDITRFSHEFWCRYSR